MPKFIFRLNFETFFLMNTSKVEYNIPLNPESSQKSKSNFSPQSKKSMIHFK